MPTPEILPHVYSSAAFQGNILSHSGKKFTLPVGTTQNVRDVREILYSAIVYYYEEVIVPPPKATPPRTTETLVTVGELDDLARNSFPGYSSLNRMQSIIYPTAYGSNENMLVCGNNGSLRVTGKTDVAMLTILRVLDQHRTRSASQSIATSIRRDAFKVIYVAPMKALAAEIVRKFAKRLQWLAIRVRELTGDMQLTKAEVAETQIIVTTPEKWDVVTRKPAGEGDVASKLKLLIIDEVHLLSEERGAVIETIVARTLRQVESSQSVIRIVGLSATLPNYIDVADFLSVSRQTGLFYFDSSFRPVPLQQHFIGVKGKPSGAQSKMNLDLVTFEKVSELVRAGHQVMVFVHARKETVKAALALRDAAAKDDILTEFSCQDHPNYRQFRHEISTSRNREMKQLFDDGFGIHHAGMLRADRNLTEKLFSARAIKVLCCTATLAWGVNLPAHAVIIKGTQVYDSSKGLFVDLSVLDVLQVFGRAGRPGLETSGQGFICTTGDKLQHYLDAVTSQSKFTKGMVDAMNAEINLGTVATVQDAVRWLGYTYLFVRMQKTPLMYGISYDDVLDDPSLNSKRHQLVLAAANSLVEARMINYVKDSGSFTITDLGRSAAKYYIHHRSIEIFNKELGPYMTEEGVLSLISLSTEFDQIQVRDNETKELASLLEQVPYDVEVLFTRKGKVNILLQGYISWFPVEDFALVSDMQYVAQNAGRIVRALLEIVISKKWASTSAVLMGMSKAIEKRIWPSDHPLKQFNLKQDVFYGLEEYADDYSVSDLVRMSPTELGNLVHLNLIHGQAILSAAQQFPVLHVSYSLRPLGSDVLKIEAHVRGAFSWSSKHDSVEPFWLWVEDHEEGVILQLSYLLLRQSIEALSVEFLISIPEGEIPPYVTIRYVFERWMGAEDAITVSFDDLVMPTSSNGHTPRLNLPFLSVSVLQNNILGELFAAKLRNLNAIQTQVFWSTVNTANNALVCAPNGSGKSTLGHILACEMLVRMAKPGYVLIIAPRHSIVIEWMSNLRGMLTIMGFPMNFVTGSKLVILENLEHLDPYYELVVTSLRRVIQTQPTRVVGFSASLNDATDLATWLDVAPSAFHAFRPSDRDQPWLSPHRPAILSVGPGPAIIFVPSRTQCAYIAQDLIVNRTLETGAETGYLPSDVSPEFLQPYIRRLRDDVGGLSNFVSKGIGLFHSGLPKQDRATVMELYAEGIVRVLVVAREACWTLPVRAAAVVVMGTQYITVQDDGARRQLRNYTLEELVQMQGRARRIKDTYMRFLEGGLPLESQLLGSDQLRQWYKRHRDRGHIRNKQEGVQALSWTFLARRAASNPHLLREQGNSRRVPFENCG
ncbi:Sec63-domain-containing protein [Russula earlei]|uniref:Sec63-domain-containing protein n=1 Tax=Russula earlei TaxID=71964 RepID=A0ACC0UNH8_9AGAM|nr:Sec63-domain-containing protein [Russula earlei]